MTVRLFVGDCLALLPTFPPSSFDAVVVDPPYGQTALAWDRRVPGWPALVRPLLKPSGSMWVFGSLRSFMETTSEFAGWRLAQDIVWEKQNGSGFERDRFRRVHEQAAMFYRDDAPWSGVYRKPQVTMDALAKTVIARHTNVPHTGKIGAHRYESVEGGPRMARSVLKVRNLHRRNTGHPTPKPDGIVAPLVGYSCPPGGLLLDPFAGSGVVGAVALQLGMSAMLIEKNPEYADAALRRIRSAANPIRIGGGHD